MTFRPRTILQALLAAAASLLIAGCSVFGIRSGTEEVPYAVIERVGEDIEIRQYPTRVVADTVIDGSDGDQARSDAFRRLFDYISGANQSGTKIAMTAPVATEREQIAMTAPVQTSVAAGGQGKGGWFGMGFFLPASYTLDTAPVPTDSRVRLIALPPETLAVLRFSGSRAADAVAARQKALLDALAGSGWRAEGEPVAFFYDPPWTLAFLRRNEVAVAVKPVGTAVLSP
jgi:hypothetical protein